MKKISQKRVREKEVCLNCKIRKFKIVRTHGKKSRGKKVCKKCGGLIK